MKKNIYENGVYLKNNPSWHQEHSFWKAKQIIRMLEKNKIYPKKVCEVGCGAGEILKTLSDKMYVESIFTGYEISPQAFSMCKQKEKNNLQFFNKNLIDDNSELFDVVLAIDVIEHIENYYEFLRKLKYKGEYKLFHIPLELSVLTILNNSPIIKGRYSVGHIHYFTKEIALAALMDSGYQIIDCFYTKGLIELPRSSYKTKLLKLPRKILFKINNNLCVKTLGGFSLLVLTK